MLDSGQVSPSSMFFGDFFMIQLLIVVLGDYKPNAFTLEDSNHLYNGKRSPFYDISRGVSTAELGRSGSSNAENGASNSKSQPHSTDISANIPSLGPAFEFDTNKGKPYAGLGAKRWGERPVLQQRIASWSDTRSAWDGDAGKYLRERRKRRRLAEGTLDGTREEEEEEEESEALDGREVETDIDGWKRIKTLGVRRYVNVSLG